METLLRRTLIASELPAPVLDHPNKRLAFELAGPQTTGSIEVTRWRAGDVAAALGTTEVVAMPGYYDYAGDSAATWHVNFADPFLFVAYGSRLLAQDELQCLEHPAFGPIRIVLGQHALTEDDGPSPVLVVGAERRCALATAPDLDAGRPYGLYGNRFAMASAEQLRAAITALRPPTRTNLIAIAAPVGSGEYMRSTLDRIVATAYTGFAAAAAESARLWPGLPVEVRTGFWGCGAFGGNRLVMSSLQIYAARLAGVARVRFYAADDAGLADLRAGQTLLDEALAAGDAIEHIADRDLRWGVSNGT